MKRINLLLTGLITCIITEAQLNESFNDGNFTANPGWIGTTTEWNVVVSSDVAAGASNSNTLRLNNGAVAATDYLSTQITGSWGSLGQTWIFWWGRRAQPATNSNRSYVWLYASEPDITSATVDGYRVRFGDDTVNDEVFIESVTNGAATIILTSAAAVTNGLTDIGFLVRVNRSTAGVFTLYTSALPSASGTGDVATVLPTVNNTPVFQGSATNTAYTDFTNGYVSIAATHSSSPEARSGAEFDQVQLVFNANASLPVKFGNVKAYSMLNGVKVEWITYSEEQVEKYEIERSADGRDFTSIGSLQAINTHSAIGYEFFDAHPLPVNSFYRIKSIDQDGQYAYSNIIRIAVNNNSTGLIIYPNPVRNGIVSLQSGNLMKGMYTVRIFNAGGQQVYMQKFDHSGGAINQTILLPVNMMAGVYYLSLSSDLTSFSSLRILR